jgi:hypothetical protein
MDEEQDINLSQEQINETSEKVKEYANIIS